MPSEHSHSDDNSSTSTEAGTNDGKRLQNVFRVSLQAKKQKPEFHPRRSHKKSRAGCSTCKKRRVKVCAAIETSVPQILKSVQCDEQKPECLKCLKRGLACCYASEENHTTDTDSSGGTVSKAVPTSTLFSLSLDNITRDIQETLNLDINWKFIIYRDRNSTRPMSTVAFHNFVRCSTATIASPAIRNVMRSDMIQVSFNVSPTRRPLLASIQCSNTSK